MSSKYGSKSGKGRDDKTRSYRWERNTNDENPRATPRASENVGVEGYSDSNLENDFSQLAIDSSNQTSYYPSAGDYTSTSSGYYTGSTNYPQNDYSYESQQTSVSYPEKTTTETEQPHSGVSTYYTQGSAPQALHEGTPRDTSGQVAKYSSDVLSTAPASLHYGSEQSYPSTSSRFDGTYITQNSYTHASLEEHDQLRPISSVSPICKCEDHNLCGVIIGPKQPIDKGGKITSQSKNKSSSSHSSSRKGEVSRGQSSKSGRLHVKGPGGGGCGPIVMPGITPSPAPSRSAYDDSRQGRQTYEQDRKSWKLEYEKWKNISCPCGYGYFDTNGLWISGGDVRAGRKNPNPLWKSTRGMASALTDREESVVRNYEARLYERRVEVESED